MKYLDEYRSLELAEQLASRLKAVVTKEWTIMEVCGGQTHSIMQYGLHDLLPPAINLVHGPGCPVCVTPLELIDKAVAIAADPGVIFCSFGDMLRVPGSTCDLLEVKARGGDVRAVYSPLDCLEIARKNPGRKVVFFAVGFETTAPANAMAVWQAAKLKLDNFFLLCSHVLVPPAIDAILKSPGNRVQAFIGPGHVCSVMGFGPYEELARRYKVPIVVAGFEPLDLLEGILRSVEQLEGGRHEVENQYARAVSREGNARAQAILADVFEVSDRMWRGIGTIAESGYKLAKKYRSFDAELAFSVDSICTQEPEVCISGEILQGKKRPYECPAFGRECTPEHPLGATMVSAEGACAAYFKYGRKQDEAGPFALSKEIGDGR